MPVIGAAVAVLDSFAGNMEPEKKTHKNTQGRLIRLKARKSYSQVNHNSKSAQTVIEMPLVMRLFFVEQTVEKKLKWSKFREEHARFSRDVNDVQ